MGPDRTEPHVHSFDASLMGTVSIVTKARCSAEVMTWRTCAKQVYNSTGACLLHHQESLALVTQPVKIIWPWYASQASLMHSTHQV